MLIRGTRGSRLGAEMGLCIVVIGLKVGGHVVGCAHVLGRGRGLLITEDLVVLYTEERPILERRNLLSPVGRVDGWLGMLLKGRVEMIERASNARTRGRRRASAIIRFLINKPCERLGCRDGMSWLE